MYQTKRRATQNTRRFAHDFEICSTFSYSTMQDILEVRRFRSKHFFVIGTGLRMRILQNYCL